MHAGKKHKNWGTINSPIPFIPINPIECHVPHGGMCDRDGSKVLSFPFVSFGPFDFNFHWNDHLPHFKTWKLSKYIYNSCENYENFPSVKG